MRPATKITHAALLAASPRGKRRPPAAAAGALDNVTPAAQQAATPATNHLVLRDAAQVATVAEYVALQLQAKATEDRLKLLNEAIKGMMGGAPVAYAGKHVLSLNEVPAIPPTENRLITAEMVGMVIPGTKGRRGYTQLSVR